MSKYERLRHLAAIIDGIPSEMFHLGFIANAKLAQQGKSPTHTCGTVGCALGYAAAHPDFPELTNQKRSYQGGRGIQLNGKKVWFHEAGAAVFGMDQDEARDLFCPNYTGFDDKTEFARRVVKFLRSKGEEVSGAYAKGVPQ